MENPKSSSNPTVVRCLRVSLEIYWRSRIFRANDVIAKLGYSQLIGQSGLQLNLDFMYPPYRESYFSFFSFSLLTSVVTGGHTEGCSSLPAPPPHFASVVQPSSLISRNNQHRQDFDACAEDPRDCTCWSNIFLHVDARCIGARQPMQTVAECREDKTTRRYCCTARQN